MKKEVTYKVEVKVTKQEQNLTLEGTVQFGCNEDDYGNGYWMSVNGMDEPSWGGVYDIRYDTEFDPDCMISYITNVYSIKFSGKRDRFRMTSIKVEEVMNE